MAYDAGAELMDVEFTQFHPTGMVWPLSVRGILVTEGVRGDGGILKNNKGERFMFNYISERFAPETADTVEEANRWLAGDKTARRPPELLTRDEVARAITAEVKAGRGSPHGGVFLDIASRVPADVIRRKLPSMYHQFKELAEVDITKEPMEVGPTLHYFMGGVRVDADSQQTTVPGLFACGECAAGLHGANRLGGNSLSDLIVFGKLAGDGANDYVKGLSSTPKATEEQIASGVRRATDILNRESGENPYLLHSKLEETMAKGVGIVRKREELETAIAELEELKAKAKNMKAPGASQYNPGWHEALSMQSLLVTSEAVTRAALMREESRGAHTRLDHPGESAEWVKYNVIIKKGADGMEVEKRPKPEGPAGLVAIANAKIEDLESGNVGADVS
jgi:succinate dehydrogenase / fumarate reductase flavoprotein subunit